MKSLISIGGLVAALAAFSFGGAAALAGELSAPDQLGVSADAVAGRLAEAGRLPPLPEGVAELKFSELFAMPIGPRGLEPTEKARALAGKRVRLLGYMVKHDAETPGVFLLAPFKLETHEDEYGLSDDLPPTVVFVEAPKFRGQAVPFTPGPMLLTGTLSIERRTIGADERAGHVHLLLDEAPAARDAVPAKIVDVR